MHDDIQKSSSATVFKKSHLTLILAALALLVLAVFSPCLNNGFINLDDNSYIAENKLIRNFSPADVQRWFSSGFEGNYYPLVQAAYALQFMINGPDPKVYHLASILLHLMNAFLVFWLFFSLLKNGWKAGVIAVLWAVHPLRVESVAWAASQKDLVYTFFSLLSLVAYLRYKQIERFRDYAASLSFFLLACFSKGMAVALVPVLFLADHYLGKPFNRRSWLEKAPYAFLAILFGVISYNVQGQSQYIQASRPLIANLLTAGYGFVFYIIKLVAPWRLSAFHPYPEAPLPWNFYLASLISVLIVAVLLTWGRKNKKVFFGGAFYLITILPVLQIVPVGGFVAAERYSYFASLGLFFIAGSCLHKMIRSGSRRVMFVAVAILVLTVTAESIVSHKRCFIWRDSITLWNDAINKYPATNAFAFNQRGTLYAVTGRKSMAVEDFTKAVTINKKYFDAYYNRGCVHYEMGQYKEATADCGKAVELYPGFAKAFNIRSIAYGRLREYQNALSDINQAINLMPHSSEFYYNRATTLAQIKDYIRALDDFNKAIELDPVFGKAYLYRGYTYYILGDRKRAEQDVQRAKSLGFVR